ncbi:MAG: hypothetical protein ACLQU4_13605 [Limisphaerales bacterium]
MNEIFGYVPFHAQKAYDAFKERQGTSIAQNQPFLSLASMTDPFAPF